jgi:hypothetical protein
VNLTKLSAIAEIISSVAILITLAYLAIQTQQNTTAIQATVRQAMLADDMAVIRQQLDYPNLVPARSGGSEVTDEELIRLNSNLLSVVRGRENQWLQYQNGVIDEQTWLTYRSAIIAVFSTEYVRSWFRNRTEGGAFDSEFVEMVDKLFAENPPLSAPTVEETLGFDPR